MAAKRNKPQVKLPAPVDGPAGRDIAVFALIVASAWSSFFALPFFLGTNTGRVFAVLLVAAGWLLTAALGRTVSVQGLRRPYAVALMLFAAAVLVSSAVSPYAARALTWGSISFFGAPVWLGLAVIALFAGTIFASEKWRIALAVAVAWVIPSLGLAAYQMGSGVPATGGFNTGNHFGVMMLVATPLVLWLAATSADTERTAWRVLALGCVAGVVLSQSSAALLGLVVAAVCVTVFAPNLIGAEGSRMRSVVRGTVWSLAAVFAVVLVAGLAVPDVLPDALTSYVRGDVLGTTFQTRIEMWKAAADVFAARPLVGFGADTYHVAAQPYLSERLFSLETGRGLLAAPPDPHALPMLFAAQFGVLGLLAGLAVLVTWLRAALSTPEAEPAERMLLRRASAAAALGFLTALLFVPWAVILGGFPAMVAGLAVALPRNRATLSRDSAIAPKGSATAPRDGATLPHGASVLAAHPRYTRVAAALAAAIFTIVALLLLVGLIQLDSAAGAANSRDAQQRYRAAARTLPTYPYARLMVLHVEGSQLGGSAEQLADWQARVDADPDMEADATYTLMLVRDSLDQAFRWGRKDVSWEEQRLDVAAKRFPNAPDLALERAHHLLLSGDLSAAERALDAAEQTAGDDSRLALYRYYLAVAQGDAAEAAGLRAQIEAEYGSQALLDPQAPSAP